MRRHTFLTALVLWLMVALIPAQPIVAAGCSVIPYAAYVPLTLSSTTAQPERLVGDFYFIKPEATTNLHTNPSFEKATTGWTGSGSTIARTTDAQRFGLYSLSVDPGTGTNSDGVYATYTTTTGLDYTASIYIKGEANTAYKIYWANSSGTLLGTATSFTATGEWQRVQATWTETGGASRRIYIAKDNNVSSAIFYLDGFQIEQKSYATTYCDGDQPGCTWSGTKYGSSSYRSRDERSGGRQISFQSLGAYLVAQQGTGMPTLTNLITPYAGIDGGYYQKSRVPPRTITLTVSVAGNFEQGWHQRRQQLIDILKPDKTFPPQPFTIVYDGGGRSVSLKCIYEDGLGIADGKRDIESIPIRCLAADPYWTADNYTATVLNTYQSAVGDILIRLSNDYQTLDDLGGGMDDQINVITVSPDMSTIYFGGIFQGAGNQTTVGRVAKYSVDSGAWSKLSTGVTKASGTPAVNAIVAAPNGDVYIGGLFDSAGGVANTGMIAKWNGSAFSALGTGISGGTVGVQTMAWGPDGKLYVGGDFTSAGGTSVKGVARWTGSAWEAVGTGPGNGSVKAMAFVGRRLYIGGTFTAVNNLSTAAGGFAYWDIDTSSSWTGQTGVDSGGSKGIYTLFPDKSGNLWVGGSFTTVNGATAYGAAQWNGTSWKTFGSITGSSAFVRAFTYDGQGRLLALGRFNTLNGFGPPDSIYTSWTVSVFTGSTFVPWGLRHGDTMLYAGAYHPGVGLLLASFNTSSLFASGDATTVTNNGSTKVRPSIVIKGPTGTPVTDDEIIYYIGNLRTNKWIYFTDLRLRAGETIVIDLSPGEISAFSDFQGNIINKIAPGTTISDFVLMPEENEIVAYAEQVGDPNSGSPTSKVYLTWTDRCWSIDSSGNS